jgi:hypothetical protein
MKPGTPLCAPDPSERRAAVGMQVADSLADAVPLGPRAAIGAARRFSDDELRLGLDFVTTVMEIASTSARAMAVVLTERGEPRVN